MVRIKANSIRSSISQLGDNVEIKSLINLRLRSLVHLMKQMKIDSVENELFSDQRNRENVQKKARRQEV
jgi:hypothetical protein